MCDNENFAEQKKDIEKCFEHIEGMLKSNFTDNDEMIIQRAREREKKRAKTKHHDGDKDVEMEVIDLPEETEELGKESLTPRSKKRSESRSSGQDDDYERAVESMKRSFDNATIVTRYAEPVDICSIVDEAEGGEFKVTNKTTDTSGPPNVRALEGVLTRAQSLSSKLPKVEHLKTDESQANKVTYRQIEPDCDRGNIEIIPQHGTTFCFKMWNGMEDPSGRFTEPPVSDPGFYIQRDTDEYLTVNEISEKLNKVLRHQTGKAVVEGRSGRQHDILPCNERGWVNIKDVLMYGHIFGDNKNYITRDATQGNYLNDTLSVRYRRCYQAMWYSKKMQNRVRFQIAAVRVSPSDVSKAEQRKYWEENYPVPNDLKCYRDHDGWMMPVAMRAVSSHNLESRHTDRSEHNIVFNPRLTSHEISDEIAIQLGGSFHVTTLGKLPSIVKHGLLPGADKGTRGSTFFNHYAPWDVRATNILRSKVPSEDVPIVPIAYLQRLGARLAESSYVVVFQGVPWDCVKSAWYKDPVQGKWKRLLTRGGHEPPHNSLKIRKHDRRERTDHQKGSRSYRTMHKKG